jgi:hypothetical protein
VALAEVDVATEHEMQHTVSGNGAGEQAARGDTLLLAGRYDEAEVAYRTALAAVGANDALLHKIERAAAGVATELQRGEQQEAVFAELLDRVAAGGGFEQAPDLPAPPAGGPPLAGPGRAVKVKAGRVLGTVGSAVFHRLTEYAGSKGTDNGVWTNWYTSGESLPGPAKKWFQILKLAYMRETLFANNLVRPYPDGVKTGYAEGALEPPEWARRWRTADGTWNDLRRDPDGKIDPMVGAAFTRFFRNVGDDRGLAGVHPRSEPGTNPVSVRELSRRLLASRGSRTEIPFLNLWAAAWIQFQNNDWVSHGTPDPERVDHIPLADDDPLRAYGVDHLDVRRTVTDPTRRPEDAGLPPTFLNEVTHWWDGSQLYGSDWRTQHRVRSFEGGKLTLTEDGRLPVDADTGTELTGFSRNWWVGLGLLHTVFAREHNAICEMLADAHPDWDDEALFQTARLVNAAVMAKIHTIEWTPAILPNGALTDGMSANWYGLVTNLLGGQRKEVLEEIPITSRELGGIVGNPQGTFAKYGLSEEFTAVYRLHSLLPESLDVVDLDGARADAVPLARTRHAGSVALIAEHGLESMARTFGEQHPCALVNNNYPAAMQDISMAEAPLVDLGAIDLYRDRERGVPTYNQLRRELSLKPIRSFAELTDDAQCVADLRDLYGIDDDGNDRVDDMDLLIGTLSESHRPEHFGFGETLFQIFILNASWRLLGDRFYTDDYRAEVYSAEGLAWVDGATFKSVLLRSFPALASTGLANVRNAFEPWDLGRLTPERHPLRAYDKTIASDPGKGDAPSATGSGPKSQVTSATRVPPAWSRSWREHLPVVDPARAADLTRRATDAVTQLQQVASKKTGVTARALHARSGAATTVATLRVADDLAPELQEGPFQPGAAWRTIVRLSSASPVPQHDATPDHRGIALRIVGAGGELQDILLTTSAAHHARDGEALVASMRASAQAIRGGLGGKLAALRELAKGIGLRDALRMTKEIDKARAAAAGRSLLACTYYSRAPFQLGPFAVKLRLDPVGGPAAAPIVDGPDALFDDYLCRRAAGNAAFRLEAQGFVDPVRTPFDDHRVAWRSEWLPLATLELPQQPGIDAHALREVVDAVSKLSFSPSFRWADQEGVLDPLGELNMLRPGAYAASGAARGNAPPCPLLPW